MQQGDGAAPERGASALLLASLFPRAGLLRFHTPLLCPACREEGGGRCHVSLACSSLLPFQLLPVGHLQLVVWLLLLLPFSAENKKDVDTIHEFLLVKGVEAVAVHGSKDQEEREWAISSFKAGGWVGGWTGGCRRGAVHQLSEGAVSQPSCVSACLRRQPLCACVTSFEASVLPLDHVCPQVDCFNAALKFAQTEVCVQGGGRAWGSCCLALPAAWPGGACARRCRMV